MVYLPEGRVDDFEEVHAELFSSFFDIIIVGDFNCNLFDMNKSVRLRTIADRLSLSVIHNSCPTQFDTYHHSTSLIDCIMMSKFSAQ